MLLKASSAHPQPSSCEYRAHPANASHQNARVRADPGSITRSRGANSSTQSFSVTTSAFPLPLPLGLEVDFKRLAGLSSSFTTSSSAAASSEPESIWITSALLLPALTLLEDATGGLGGEGCKKAFKPNWFWVMMGLSFLPALLVELLLLLLASDFFGAIGTSPRHARSGSKVWKLLGLVRQR